MKKNINPKEKYYVQKKYKISFDGIKADIQISKAMETFISEKLPKNKNENKNNIESFKAFVPYVDFEYIIGKLNLKESKKVFIISSDEVFKRSSDIEKLRQKRNREFLKDKIIYTTHQDIDGKPFIKKEILDKTLNIVAFKYNAGTKDTEVENFFNLHSKIYLINDRYAFIGSANLTENALKNNYETLFFIDGNLNENNNRLIDELIDFFNKVQEEKNIMSDDIFFEPTNDSAWENEKKEITDKYEKQIQEYREELEKYKNNKKINWFSFFKKI